MLSGWAYGAIYRNSDERTAALDGWLWHYNCQHSGQPDRVIAMREDFQRVMAERYKQMIEELTDRKVLAFLSQAHVEPDITMEIFFVDRPLDGFGALELVEPE